MMPKGRPRKSGPRQPNGQPSRAGQDPRRTVMLARAAHTGHALAIADGGPFISKKDAAMLQQPWMGCFAGRSIAAEADVVELWGVIKTIRQRRAAWLSSVGAPAEAAKGAAIATTPNPREGGFAEPMPYDPRTDAERAADARRLWDAMEALMFAANPLLQAAVCLDREVRGDVAAWVRQVGKAL